MISIKHNLKKFNRHLLANESRNGKENEISSAVANNFRYIDNVILYMNHRLNDKKFIVLIINNKGYL